MIAQFFQQILSLAFLIGVLGNLVAAIVWALPALIHLHKKIDRNHKEHMDAIRNKESGK